MSELTGGNTADAAVPAPSVSVVIPSKDRPEMVRRAVEAALAQQGLEFEVVVVDDGSQPPVSLGLDDERVRVIRHDAPQGVARARNRGVEEARGRWVAFLDDDDLWSPNKLRVQIEDLERSGRRWGCPATAWLTGDLEVRDITQPPAPPITVETLRVTNTVGSPSGVVAERELVREVGGFDPRFSIYADWDLWLRMAAVAEGSSVREILLGYVTHDGSMHRQSVREAADELARLRRHHRHGQVGRVEGVGIWRWIAATQLDLGRRPWAATLMLYTAVRFLDRRALVLAVKWFGRIFFPRRQPSPPKPRPAWLDQPTTTVQPPSA